MFEKFRYQRQIVAYHGCDASVRDLVLGGGNLKGSDNDYDWLGKGIYFWEHGPERALEWAKEQKSRGRIKSPAVLGAFLNTGQCFDLLDSKFTDVLSDSFLLFRQAAESEGRSLPSNGFKLKRLDCAVINWTITQLENRLATKFHSVRGMFQEGGLVYPDSAIQTRSHIQIAVRDSDCVIGYFLPSF